MQAGRFDAAATIYAELVTARPNDAGLLMNLGMARYMAGHPIERSLVLRKAVALNKSLAPASLFLGASLLDLGQFAEASAPLQQAVTLMPNEPGCAGDAGAELPRVSRPAKAAAQYRTLTTLQPRTPKPGTASREATKTSPKPRSSRCKRSRQTHRSSS